MSDLDVQAFARKIRGHALRMVHRANASHIGSCFSIADLVAALFSTMRIGPALLGDPTRDRFILSKGHAAAVVYAALAVRGFFPETELDNYCVDGSNLTGHINHMVPGVEVSTGSLGHGLPIGCGMALAGARASGGRWRVFVVLSDGELDEGSNWEAILFAGHQRLDNLVAIVDYNKWQSFGRTSDVMGLDPLADKWRAFGWGVREIDGHDYSQIGAALREVPVQAGHPTVIIAHTTKGKGVDFMENRLEWHYKSPNAEQLARGLAQLGGDK